MYPWPRSRPTVVPRVTRGHDPSWWCAPTRVRMPTGRTVAPTRSRNCTTTTTKYEEAVKLLIAAAPPRSLQGISEPTWKSLRDRFKKVAADRRDKNKKPQAASGIVEEGGEREVLLDDLILAMDEHEEENRQKGTKGRRRKGGCLMRESGFGITRYREQARKQR